MPNSTGAERPQTKSDERDIARRANPATAWRAGAASWASPKRKRAGERPGSWRAPVENLPVGIGAGDRPIALGDLVATTKGAARSAGGGGAVVGAEWWWGLRQAERKMFRVQTVFAAGNPSERGAMNRGGLKGCTAKGRGKGCWRAQLCE